MPSTKTVTEEYIYDDGKLVKKVVTTVVQEWPSYYYPKPYVPTTTWPIVTCIGTSTFPNGTFTYNGWY